MSTPTLAMSDSEIWKVLLVDDDANYRAALQLALEDCDVLGRKLELLQASNAIEASQIVKGTSDIALILLDVVMEEDDSGLRLVEHIRNVIGNTLVRIVLLTGQPGFAPETHVIEHFEIDDYWLKTQINDKIETIITSQLRSWKKSCELHNAQLGLELLVDSTRNLFSRYNLEEFSEYVLLSIFSILGIDKMEGGVLCKINPENNDLDLICRVGCYEYNSAGSENIHAWQELLSAEELELYKIASETKKSIFNSTISVIFCVGKKFKSFKVEPYCIVVRTAHCLSEHDIKLLELFGLNVQTGFSNIGLTNHLQSLAYIDQSLGIQNANWLQRELRLLNNEERSSFVLLCFCLESYANQCHLFGDAFGDNKLKAFVESIKERSDVIDTVCRINQDTLAFLVKKDRQSSFDSILKSHSCELTVNGNQFEETIISGIIELDTFSRANVKESIDLARNMIFACKQRGENFFYYSAKKLNSTANFVELKNQLAHAIERQEIQIFLQPKVCLTTLKIISFEALARWPIADGDFIYPDVFIPIAVSSGLISRLDLLFLNQTVKTLNQFIAKGFRLPISFNASCSDLLNDNYISYLFTALDEECYSDLLELEITESQFTNQFESIAATLRTLQKRGLKVHLDDFGTGYSSLSRLMEMSLDVLKLDKAFIQSRENSAINQQIIELILELGHNNHIKIVAEGIETKEDADWLKLKGCHYGQGYYFAKPMPVDAIIELMENDPNQFVQKPATGV